MKTCQTISKSERASAIVLTTIFLMVLFAFAALGLDVGNLLTHQRQLQDMADATALGAVQDWGLGKDATTTKNSGATIANNNNLRVTDVIAITCGVWNASTTNFVANQSTFTTNAVPAVKVALSRVVETAFMRLFGWPTLVARGNATAIAAQAIEANGVVPLLAAGIEHPNPQPGDILTLKYPEQGVILDASGNTGAADMPGKQSYKENLKFGYNGIVAIGNVYQTTPGLKTGTTQEGINYHIANVGTTVIVMTISDIAKSGKSDFTVTGFWVVDLTATDNAGVTGTFLKSYSGGTKIDPSKPPVVGLNGVGLVQ